MSYNAGQIEIIAATLARFYGEDCPAALVYRASWPEQKIIRGTVGDIAAKVLSQGIRKTAMIIVGRALSGDIPVSKLYDPSFTHGYRRGKAE